MVEAPLVMDLAVAAAYQLSAGSDFLGHAITMIRSYHQVLPLQEEELDVLFDLMLMRHAMTIAITHWRANLHPENKEYILRNCPHAVASFEEGRALSRDYVNQQIRAALA